jgi:hypothetical protein
VDQKSPSNSGTRSGEHWRNFLTRPAAMAPDDIRGAQIVAMEPWRARGEHARQLADGDRCRATPRPAERDIVIDDAQPHDCQFDGVADGRLRDFQISLAGAIGCHVFLALGETLGLDQSDQSEQMASWRGRQQHFFSGTTDVVEMDADREERERIVIEIRKLRAKLRDAADPSAARVVDGLLRNAEARLAGLLEQAAV